MAVGNVSYSNDEQYRKTDPLGDLQPLKVFSHLRPHPSHYFRPCLISKENAHSLLIPEAGRDSKRSTRCFCTASDPNLTQRNFNLSAYRVIWFIQKSWSRIENLSRLVLIIPKIVFLASSGRMHWFGELKLECVFILPFQMLSINFAGISKSLVLINRIQSSSKNPCSLVNFDDAAFNTIFVGI